MNITLIGMAGVGKSTIGSTIAVYFGLEFIDTDVLIKKKMGSSLQSLIEKNGDEAFMKLEEKTILDLPRREQCLISTGGSVIYSEKAINYLKEWSTVVLLEDSFENIASRIIDPESRGLVGLKNGNLRELFRQRRKLYLRYADLRIDLRGFHNKETAASGMILFLSRNLEIHPGSC
jgi:shikimate kinase